MQNIVYSSRDVQFTLGHLGVDPNDPTFRDRIEMAIEGLINLLDTVDGDCDLEFTTSPDDREYCETDYM